MMTGAQQTPETLQDDLRFVREVVARRERRPMRPAAIYWYWAVYVLVGYFLIDVRPMWAQWFFLAGLLPGFLWSAYVGWRMGQTQGERDSVLGRKLFLHWFGGVMLTLVSVVGLASVVKMGPYVPGQICVVMMGLLYFLGGVHFDRWFLFLGPVLMLGGICVGLVPAYGWTALGVVIALGLVGPTLVGSRPKQDGTTDTTT